MPELPFQSAYLAVLPVQTAFLLELPSVLLLELPSVLLLELPSVLLSELPSVLLSELPSALPFRTVRCFCCRLFHHRRVPAQQGRDPAEVLIP